MKILSEIKMAAMRFLALVAVAAPMMVSCYDDSELQQQIDMLVDKVFALEEQMNAELATLKGLLEGKLFITDVTTDGGTTNVMLSDSTLLKLLPKQDMKSFVSYITLADGTKCWAYVDENGQKQLFLDEQNHPVPVMAETPEVIVKDDETWIVIGGSEYPLSGNSVFSDYEVIADEETGEVLAVTFTFGETMTFTVTVNSGQGFWFVSENGTDEVKFDSYFVNAGQTVRVQVKSKGVEDYVVQLPDGWKYKEVEDKLEGRRYFDITAPSAEALAAGASSEGNLKVLAVLNGGKASAARLYLTTNPFKKLNVSYGKVSIERYPGLEKYIYGICAAADYDSAAIMDAVKGLKDTDSFPEGYKVADADMSAIALSELSSASFVIGSEYVIWAVPMVKGEEEYTAVENTIIDFTFSHSTVDVKITAEDFLDATLKMELAGITAYFVGVELKDAYDEEAVLAGLNAGRYTSRTDPMSHEGSLFGLVGVEANHSTDYVFWFAVAGDSKTYTSDDLIVLPFKTSTFTAGGTIAVKVDEDGVAATPTTISVPLSAEGASIIFYTYLKETDSRLSGTDEALVDHVFKKGVQVNAAEVVAGTADEGVKLSLKDEEGVVLVAIAVDANGKYGQILKYGCMTSALKYNDIDVKINVLRQDPGNVVLKFASAGDDADYIYWVGPATNPFWTSSRYLGGSAEAAAKYIALNPDNFRFTDTASKYPVSSDGTVRFDDLAGGTTYVAVCVAVDGSGITSVAETVTFKVYTYPIGTVVKKTDSKWEAARPTVEWIEERFMASSGQMSGAYGFNVSIPLGFSAYVLGGTDSYLTEGNPSVVLTVEDRILKIIEYVDKSRDWHLTTTEDWVWPHIGYEHYHSEHGAPLWANSIIWASEEYHDSVCDCGGNFQVTQNMQGHDVTVTHLINVNGEGKKFEFRQPQAVGSTSEVIDKVFIVCFDHDGNCYEDFVFDVPVEIFQNADSRDN